MIQKFLLQSFLVLAFIFVFGVASEAFAQGDIPISGAVGNGRLEKGKSAVVSVVLDIPGGLHVNSNRPSKPALIPTRIRVTAPGLKIGAVNYPRGAMKKFGFSEEPLSVYEGRTILRFNVTVPPNFKGNVAKIRAVVDYQPCTDEVCYRPRSGDITLSAAVR
jgi:hypothetical protein